MNDAERAKKDLEQQEYYDPAIADEEREKGVNSQCNFEVKHQELDSAVDQWTIGETELYDVEVLQEMISSSRDSIQKL
jgi:hypothetical protein